MHIRKCIAVILIRLFKQSPRLYPQGKEPKKSSVGKSSNVESVEESSANTSRKDMITIFPTTEDHFRECRFSQLLKIHMLTGSYGRFKVDFDKKHSIVN